VLRKISGSNSEEVTGEWGKLLEKELLGLYCSPDILRLIASRRMGWERHVARMEKKIIRYLKESDHLGGLYLDFVFILQ